MRQSLNSSVLYVRRTVRFGFPGPAQWMQPQVSRSTIPFQISVQEKLDRTPLLYTVMQKLQNSISSHVEVAILCRPTRTLKSTSPLSYRAAIPLCSPTISASERAKCRHWKVGMRASANIHTHTYMHETSSTGRIDHA